MNAFCRPHDACAGLVLALTLAATPGLAGSGPPLDYILTDNADLAFTSPDGATGIEQIHEGRRRFRGQMAGLGEAWRTDD